MFDVYGWGRTTAICFSNLLSGQEVLETSMTPLLRGIKQCSLCVPLIVTAFSNLESKFSEFTSISLWFT